MVSSQAANLIAFVIFATVTMDEEGVLRVQGQEIEAAALKSAVQELIAGKEKKIVMLKIDKNLTHDKYKKVLLELSEVGAELALVGKKETQ